MTTKKFTDRDAHFGFYAFSSGLKRPHTPLGTSPSMINCRRRSQYTDVTHNVVIAPISFYYKYTNLAESFGRGEVATKSVG